MENTKHEKIEFGQIASVQNRTEMQECTRYVRQNQFEMITIKPTERTDVTFSGYRKVNYAEQKIKETYRRINKMLGGN